MNRISSRSWIVVVIALILVAGTVFFVGEFMGNARDWALFDGSPHVYSGTKLASGTVTDREGTLLLDMSGDRTYASDPTVRKSVLHWVGDRLGNVSTPVLNYYAEEMVGYDLLNGVYNYGGAAGEMKLTISARVQATALEAMGSYKGCVAVYNYKTGEILCAVSTPTFDPENTPDLAEDEAGAYDGVYLNRFLQSTYIPGSIFKMVTTAAALETVPDILERTFTCKGVLEVGGGTVTCEIAHGTQNLEKTLSNSCNCAFAEIAQLVGGEKLQQYADAFGITSSMSFDGYTTAAGNFEAEGANLYDLSWSGIGQYTDLVNPCQFMTFMGTIANGGVGVEPHIVKSITVGDAVTYSAGTVKTDRVMSRSTAQTLQELMRNNVEVHYGVENFPDVWVCAKTGTGELDGDVAPNATLCGFVMDEKYPLAFIVVVQEGGYGRQTCIPIINGILSACMEVLDSE